MSGERPLACPRCGVRQRGDEAFCEHCGTPLTYEGNVDVEQAGDALQQHARKIKPQYARGELREVAVVTQLPEAEMIQNLLLESGVPSILRRTTWDVPEFLAAGPRAVLVPESGYLRALDALNKTETDVEREQQLMREARPAPLRLLAGVAVAILVVSAVIVLLSGNV